MAASLAESRSPGKLIFHVIKKEREMNNIRSISTAGCRAGNPRNHQDLCKKKKKKKNLRYVNTKERTFTVRQKH